MATLRNKSKLEALNREDCEEYPISNLAQKSNVPRLQEDYEIQVSWGTDGRDTKEMSQECSKTENRTLGALSGLDDFFMNPLNQVHSGNTSETSRTTYGANQGMIEDDFQKDLHPEAGIFQRQTTKNYGPEEGHDIFTGSHKEVRYCSPKTSSGKQKKATLPVKCN